MAAITKRREQIAWVHAWEFDYKYKTKSVTIMDEKILKEFSPSWSASRPRGASWWGRMLRRLPSWGSSCVAMCSCVCIFYLSRRRDWSRWRRGCGWRSRPTQCSRAVLGEKTDRMFRSGILCGSYHILFMLIITAMIMTRDMNCGALCTSRIQR